SIRSLLFRTKASGALQWFRFYSAGVDTLFTAIAPVNGSKDFVVVGERTTDASPPEEHAVVLRVGPSGDVAEGGGGHRWAVEDAMTDEVSFQGVTSLTVSPHAGHVVISGWRQSKATQSIDLLLISTGAGADLCQPEVARVYPGVGFGFESSIAEVLQALPGA